MTPPPLLLSEKDKNSSGRPIIFPKWKKFDVVIISLIQRKHFDIYLANLKRSFPVQCKRGWRPVWKRNSNGLYFKLEFRLLLVVKFNLEYFFQFNNNIWPYPGETNGPDAVRKHVTKNGRERITRWEVSVKPRVLPMCNLSHSGAHGYVNI
jgi:hypothetical protein